jgi:hypothetical protein
MIKRMVMVFIHGIMVGNIRVTLIMTIVMATVSYLIPKMNSNTKDSGIMENKQIEI